jgi:hypothetical protein
MLCDVFAGKHGVYTGHCPCCLNIDRFDSRVRAGAAHERHVQSTRRQQIIDEPPGASYKTLGLFSSDSFSNGRMDRKVHSHVQFRVLCIAQAAQIFRPPAAHQKQGSTRAKSPSDRQGLSSRA